MLIEKWQTTFISSWRLSHLFYCRKNHTSTSALRFSQRRRLRASFWKLSLIFYPPALSRWSTVQSSDKQSNCCFKSVLYYVARVFSYCNLEDYSPHSRRIAGKYVCTPECVAFSLHGTIFKVQVISPSQNLKIHQRDQSLKSINRSIIHTSKLPT